MKKMRVLIILLIASMLLSGATFVEVDDDVKGYLLMDHETGKIIQSKNIDEPMAMASVSKLMSCIVLMDAISKGEIRETDTVTASKDALLGGSSFKMVDGETYTIKELLDASLVVSGNDATYLYAKALAGSEKEFVNRMNEKAKELKMTTAVFYNSSGLPTYPGEIQNTASIRDMVKMTDHIITKYPQLLEITSKPWIVCGEDKTIVKNTNPILHTIEEVDGLKTGYTGKAGFCLIFTMLKRGIPYRVEDSRFIGIAMGCRDKNKRDVFVENMAQYAISNYRKEIILHSESSIMDLYFKNGKERIAKVYPKKNYSKLIRYNEKMDIETLINEKINLPIKQGDKVGEVIVLDKGAEIYRTDLIIDRDIKKAGIFLRLKRWIKGD